MRTHELDVRGLLPKHRIECSIDSEDALYIEQRAYDEQLVIYLSNILGTIIIGKEQAEHLKTYLEDFINGA